MTAGRRRSRRAAVGDQLVLAGILIAALVAWEVSIQSGLLERAVPNAKFWFSSPTLIVARAKTFAASGELFRHLFATLYATVAGLVFGSALGIALGFVLAASEALARVADPYIVFLNAMPRIALAPVFILLFGIGVESKIAAATSLVVFVLLVQTCNGARNVDRDLVAHLRAMGATRLQLIRVLVLPATIPWIYSGLKVAAGLSLMGTVTAEFVAARAGMGYVIQYGMGYLDVSYCYVGILVLSGVAHTMNAVFNYGEARLLRWRPEGKA